MAVSDKIVKASSLKIAYDDLKAKVEAEAIARSGADTVQSEAMTTLNAKLKSGSEQDAEYHLGFYLDENGDLCQVETEG